MDMLMLPGTTDITELDTVLHFRTGCLIRSTTTTAGLLVSTGTGIATVTGIPSTGMALMPTMHIRLMDSVMDGDTGTGERIQEVAGLFIMIIETTTPMFIMVQELVVSAEIIASTNHDPEV